MILLIEYDNGEQWDDYHKWIAHIIDIKTDKSKESLMEEWKAYFVKLMKTKKVTVNPYHVDSPLIDSRDLKDRNTDEAKMHYSLIDKQLHKKRNSFYYYLKKNYEVTDITFETIHDHYNKLKK